MNASLKAGFDGGGVVYNLVEFRNKTVVIVGASRGIGRGTALLLSKLGARLILIARSEAGLKETMSMLEGSGHGFYTLDVGDTESIEECAKRIVQNEGLIDGLVYCAGVAVSRPLQQFKPAVVNYIMKVNFMGFVETVRCFTKMKRFNPGLRIVGISSIAAVIGDKAHTVYAASKAAMDAAVRCLAKELANKSICINTVEPAFIKTAMYDSYIKANGEELIGRILERQYLGTGTAEDVASAIAFLLSGAARFITGVCLPVDGGATSN